ncbi:MAG: hypothetical protein HY795_00480 [Desulfovibrio sp.]|nr:hypothetical protein [Desulfovibrio sp.]MBI4958470.1 hypothetical protein [Desulfovibrio sp.]
MAYYQIAILALLLCLTPACVKKAPELAPEPPAKPAPGPKLLLEYEALSRELQCDNLKLPMLALEANTLNPERVAPGGEVHHRFIYAFCPASGGGSEKGVLTRKLSLKGKTVFLDQDKDFILTPGRSAVDAFFLVPETAPPGTYVLELDFKEPAKGQRGSKPPSFNVKETLFIGTEE